MQGKAPQAWRAASPDWQPRADDPARPSTLLHFCQEPLSHQRNARLHSALHNDTKRIPSHLSHHQRLVLQAILSGLPTHTPTVSLDPDPPPGLQSENARPALCCCLLLSPPHGHVLRWALRCASEGLCSTDTNIPRLSRHTPAAFGILHHYRYTHRNGPCSVLPSPKGATDPRIHPNTPCIHRHDTSHCELAQLNHAYRRNAKPKNHGD